MKFRKLPSQAFLKSVLEYDPATGAFTRKHREGAPAVINCRYAGKQTGTVNDSGYVLIGLDYVNYRAHRLAWVLMHGGVLDEHTEVDHKNLNRSDNRLDNLRLASKSNNSANTRAKHSKWDLPKGVERNKLRFTARIMKDGRRECLGTYDTPEEAHEVYRAVAAKYHGEFARSA